MRKIRPVPPPTAPFSLGASTSQSWTRRAFLGVAGGLTVQSLLAQTLDVANAEFTFVVVNDIHYRDDRCGLWLEKVTNQIKALRPAPRFVMLAGDLSDQGTAAQLSAVRNSFRDMPFPVRAVPGNHDCLENGDFSAYRQTFPGPLNYRFREGGWQFLALDSTDGRSVYRTRIPRETLDWVAAETPKLRKGEPLVILTHFPLGRNWLRPVNAHALIASLRRHDLRATMGGHWHGITEREEGGIHLSTNRCCSWWRENHDGSPLKGFALCHVSPAAIRHEFVPVT